MFPYCVEVHANENLQVECRFEGGYANDALQMINWQKYIIFGAYWQTFTLCR